MEESLQWLVEGGWGYPGIFLLLLGCGYGVPFPEDVPLLAAGVMAAHGGLSVPVASLACGFFVLIRDLSVWWLGARYGTALLSRPWARRIVSEDAVAIYSEKIRRNGNKVVFAGRFIMGFRAAVFFSAGVSGVPFRTFVFWDGLALLPSIPLFVWLGYAFAFQLDRLGDYIGQGRAILAVIGALVVAWFVAMWVLEWVRRRVNAMAAEEAEVDSGSGA